MSIANIGLVLVFMSFAIAFLPSSPFTAFIEAIKSIPYLAQLNWFLPISEMIAVGEAWLVAVTAFYVVSLILRWMKAIE